MHTVKIVVYFAAGCSTATTIALTSIKQKVMKPVVKTFLFKLNVSPIHVCDKIIDELSPCNMSIFYVYG